MRSRRLKETAPHPFKELDPLGFKCRHFISRTLRGTVNHALKHTRPMLLVDADWAWTSRAWVKVLDIFDYRDFVERNQFWMIQDLHNVDSAEPQNKTTWTKLSTTATHVLVMFAVRFDVKCQQKVPTNPSKQRVLELRPYTRESTGSRPISAVKLVMA
jgi:hypothetical protein